MPNPVVKCDEARRWLAVRFRGGIGVTEWALAETHRRQCPECREALAQLLPAIQPRRRMAEVRALLGSRSKVIETLHSRFTPPVDLVVWLRSRLAIPLERSLRGVAGGAEAVRRSVSRSAGLIVRLRSCLAISLERSLRAVAGGVAATRLGVTRSVVLMMVRLRSPLVIPRKRSLQAVGVGLGLALALFTLRQTPRPEPTVLSVPALAPRPVPTQLASFAPPPAESGAALPATPRVIEPQPFPSRTSAVSSQRSPGPGPARETPTPPAPALERVPHPVDVVGRLSVKDRRVTERGLTALLERAGGTELGRHRTATLTVVDVVVPQSSYNEFAIGLARIGSWHLEAARSPLPDGVQMTIRVSE